MPLDSYEGCAVTTSSTYSRKKANDPEKKTLKHDDHNQKHESHLQAWRNKLCSIPIMESKLGVRSQQFSFEFSWDISKGSLLTPEARE